ncbi:MAG: hypothetical protein Q9187_000060 [Circinaria calcarea]
MSSSTSNDYQLGIIGTTETVAMSTVIADRVAMSPPPHPSPARTVLTSETLAMRSLRRLSFKSPELRSKQNGNSQYVSNTPALDTRNALAADGTPARKSSNSSESSTFLTTLATQERRVLELKEELQKAESDLETLKKQWASHEATKKKDELRHSEQLRTIAFPTRITRLNLMAETPCIMKDQERHKAMYIQTRQPPRKVFAGSRHTRTLSLLTSTPTYYDKTTPEISMASPKSPRVGTAKWPARSATSPEFIFYPASSRDLPAMLKPSTSIPKEDLVITGKQFFGDLREGLWTFIEDLKQTTVGEEAVSNVRSRRTRGERTDLPSIVYDTRLPTCTKQGFSDMKLSDNRGDPVGALDSQTFSKPRGKGGRQELAQMLRKAQDLENSKEDGILPYDDGWGK